MIAKRIAALAVAGTMLMTASTYAAGTTAMNGGGPGFGGPGFGGPGMSIGQVAQQNANNVSLTDSQKKQIDGLYQKVLDDFKVLVQKQVSYGAITQDRANVVVAKLRERYAILKNNGYNGIHNQSMMECNAGPCFKMGMMPPMPQDENQGQKTEQKKAKEFTSEQQKQLASSLQKLIDDTKPVIQKYVDFGVMIPEHADVLYAEMQEHLDMAKENGFKGMQGPCDMMMEKVLGIF